MCGIAGIISKDVPIDMDILKRMSQELSHRGPDSKGIWCGHNRLIGFAHQRLAIVDLSNAGNQPIASHSGRFHMIFNGEIYNHRVIRKGLQRNWRGSSDTETLVESIAEWGLVNTLQKIVGMFAIAIWDQEKCELILARDRMGEKPLYYSRISPDLIVFSSELTSIITHPKWRGNLSSREIINYLKVGHTSKENSIYEGIKKIIPGTFVRIKLKNLEVETLSYWNLSSVINSYDRSKIIREGDEFVIKKMESLLQTATNDQNTTDVPTGIFLSGGIDSTLITAIAAKSNLKDIQTYSIGFEDPSCDESKHAENIANYFGTRHSSAVLTVSDAKALIPQMASIYDEPLADSSQIPTTFLSQIACKQVKVALTGDGADELFGGYNRHLLIEKIWPFSRIIPHKIRTTLSKFILNKNEFFLDEYASHFFKILPALKMHNQIGSKLHKFSDYVLNSETIEDMYHKSISYYNQKELGELLLCDANIAISINGYEQLNRLSDLERLLYLDQNSYLQNNILVKVDRASMANSLETRMPFLDHRVIEYSWSLPENFKIRNGQTKWILRQILNKYIPQNLYRRPKSGFGIPLNAWLRGPLKDWAYEMLSVSNIKKIGILNPIEVQRLLARYMQGEDYLQKKVWNIVILQSWAINQKQSIKF